VSVVGLGGNNFGRPGSATAGLEGTRAVLDAAIDSGITLIDTAEMYGVDFGQSESLIGAALLGRRDEVLLATKFGHEARRAPGTDDLAIGSRAYIRAAVDGSLSRLGTDRIDLYQQHTPDPRTPIDETSAALDELIDEGKILAYGHSNFAAAQMRAAAGGRWVSAQDEYSLIRRGAERELLPTARDLELGFLPYYPLFNGLLTGKFSRDLRPADTRLSRQRPELLESAPWDALDAYAEFCAERGITMLAATFGWMLAQPPVSSVIAGATLPEQVRANADAATWTPEPDDVERISAIFSGEPA
jgi:aryl-alcohol dehydrogenase-like predicted oxidoreductase